MKTRLAALLALAALAASGCSSVQLGSLTTCLYSWRTPAGVSALMALSGRGVAGLLE